MFLIQPSFLNVIDLFCCQEVLEEGSSQEVDGIHGDPWYNKMKVSKFPVLVESICGKLDIAVTVFGLAGMW